MISNIVVKDITPRGLDVEETVNASDIGLLDEEIKCLSPLSIKASLKRAEDAILAEAEVEGKYLFQCSRCLTDVEYDSVEQYNFDYPVEDALDVINLGEDIRQEMILGIPTKILCKEDCKGICAGCGVNLNKEKCKCKK